MKIFAYSYTEPLLDTIPDKTIWGWEVDRVYQDLGERRQLEELLGECKNKPPDYLLIRRVEELGESVEEVCDRLTQLESFGIQIIPLESELSIVGKEAATTSKIITRIDILKFFQQIQENQRSRQIRKGHARNRLKALPPPGKAPYGYRRGKDRYALDRSAAAVVKDFFENFLLYGSLRGSVRYIEKKHGKKISVTTGRRWLTNAAYRGDLEYRNGETISNTHLPIISREEAAQVDRLLRRNSRLAPRAASAPRSLAGLVGCARCQSQTIVTKVSSSRQEREYLYLRAASCPLEPKCKALSYREVLEKTVAAICRELPPAVAGLEMPNMEGAKGGIQGAIATKQGILSQLAELVGAGVLDNQTAELRAYKLRTEIAELQGKLAQLPPVNLIETVKAVSYPQFWLDLSESERRFYFREFIERVEIVREGKEWELELVFIF